MIKIGNELINEKNIKNYYYKLDGNKIAFIIIVGGYENNVFSVRLEKLEPNGDYSTVSGRYIDNVDKLGAFGMSLIKDALNEGKELSINTIKDAFKVRFYDFTKNGHRYKYSIR